MHFEQKLAFRAKKFLNNDGEHTYFFAIANISKSHSFKH